MMSKTFVIGWSKTGLVWTTHSLMSAKILYGNAVSPGHVIRAGLQNGIMLAWARQKFQALLDWNICRRWIEHRGSSPEHSDILYMVKTYGGVDAAERLHLPLLPTPSVIIIPPPPGTPFQISDPNTGAPYLLWCYHLHLHTSPLPSHSLSHPNDVHWCPFSTHSSLPASKLSWSNEAS